MAKREEKATVGSDFISDNKWVFQYKNRLCDCLLNTESLSEKKRIYSYTLIPKPDSDIVFAHNASKGMVVVDTTGHITPNHNIIGDFMALSLEDNFESANELQKFIKKYGFFFNLQERYRINYCDLCTVLKKLQDLYCLLDLTLSSKTDYKKMFNVMIGFENDHTHTLKSNEEIIFTTYEHLFHRYFFNADPVAQDHDARHDYYFINKTGDDYEDIENGYCKYDTKDTFKDSTDTHTLDYKYFEGSSDLNRPSNETSTLLFLHEILNDKPIHIRHIVDFLYNAIFICSFSDDEIEECGLIHALSSVNWNENKGFTGKYKNFLKEVSKGTLKEEFDNILRRVHPIFNTSTFKPDLYIEDLFTAIYLSLYYWDRDEYHYKKCEKESCHHLFYVKNSRKKAHYCSTKCANAEYGRKHRDNNRNNKKAN